MNSDVKRVIIWFAAFPSMPMPDLKVALSELVTSRQREVVFASNSCPVGRLIVHDVHSFEWVDCWVFCALHIVPSVTSRGIAFNGEAERLTRVEWYTVLLQAFLLIARQFIEEQGQNLLLHFDLFRSHCDSMRLEILLGKGEHGEWSDC